MFLGAATANSNLSSFKIPVDISGIDDQVISLYAGGFSVKNIYDQLQNLYEIETAEMISKIADQILPELKE